MSQTLKNLKIVSLYFLLFFGIIHILSGIFYTQEINQNMFLFVNRISDLPFLASSLSYFGTYLIEKLDPEISSVKSKIIFAGLALIFIIALIINIIFNDTAI